PRSRAATIGRKSLERPMRRPGRRPRRSEQSTRRSATRAVRVCSPPVRATCVVAAVAPAVARRIGSASLGRGSSPARTVQGRTMSEPGGRLIGLHHVQLAMPEGEEDAAVYFYQDVLGLVRIEKPAQLAPRGGVWFRSGDLEVHLGVEEGFRPAVKAHPAFMVEDINGVRERLESAGYKVV